MPEKITTIEDLAVLIQRTMASKEDLQALRQEMLEELNATHADVRYIRSTTDKL